MLALAWEWQLRRRLAAAPGISDPYEPPGDADLVIDTTDTNPENGARQLLALLTDRGYLDRRP
jgi:sulfate adenylyltransferase